MASVERADVVAQEVDLLTELILELLPASPARHHPDRLPAAGPAGTRPPGAAQRRARRRGDRRRHCQQVGVGQHRQVLRRLPPRLRSRPWPHLQPEL